jgi:thiol:disulfide interchange protein
MKWRPGLIGLVLFVGVVMLVRWYNSSAPPPPVFSHLELEQAKGAIKGTGQVLLVKATAPWCGPCKMMNQTTFRDPRIEKWIKANGLAIELNVDQHMDLAQKLNVQALPALIVFDGTGAEVQRTMGALDAETLLAWMNEAKLAARGGGG